MPELAEVETIRLQLDPMLVDKTILSFECTHPRSIRRNKKSEVKNALVGNKITKTSRHGKYLSIHFKDHILNIHLRMSGRMLSFKNADYDPKQNPKHSHIVFKTDEDTILFIDPRTFGEMWLDDMSHLAKGVDALSGDETILDVLENISSSRMLKTILLDQSVISGIGNIYADEICARSKIAPDRRFNEISHKEKILLAENVRKVLSEAVIARGSSLRDETFRDIYGELGQYQKAHLVHDRLGKPCICGTEIEKIKVAGRSTYFCPKCQK